MRALRLLRGLCVVATLVLGGAVADAATLQASAFDRDGHPLTDALVYLEPANPADLPPLKVEDAVVAQEGMEFKPYVTVIHPGARVTFPNRDNVDHHVKSFSAAKPFEIKIFSSGTPAPVLFDKPGIVALNCLIHDWMRAYILVLDTPYFAKVDNAGTAVLDNVPPGRYTAYAWHPDLGTFLPPLQASVEVTADTKLRFDFPIVPRKKRSGPSGHSS